MAETTREDAERGVPTWRPLVLTYVALAALGFVLGVRGLLPFGDKLRSSASSPLARLGFALKNVAFQADPEDWAALEQDLGTVRLASNSKEPQVLELVMALRGIKSAGSPEWVRAEQLCHDLNWRRCDRPALEEMKRRSRP